MMIIGSNELVLGMKFCGVKKSYIFKTPEDILEKIKYADKKEIIIANASVIEKVPELKEFPNLASIPDKLDDFGNVDDLKYIVKSAIGVEMEGL